MNDALVLFSGSNPEKGDAVALGPVLIQIRRVA
jgi:hypothetical protein